MVDQVAAGALLVVAAYLALGLLFAIVFLTFGIGRVDHAARGAPWSFRALVAPGVVALWPVLLRLWLQSGRRR